MPNGRCLPAVVSSRPICLNLIPHPGPLRDLVVDAQRAWVARLSGELKLAVKQGDIVNSDPELSAFQIEAVLRSANTALRLGEPAVTRKVWRVVDSFLTAADK